MCIYEYLYVFLKLCGNCIDMKIFFNAQEIYILQMNYKYVMLSASIKYDVSSVKQQHKQTQGTPRGSRRALQGDGEAEHAFSRSAQGDASYEGMFLLEKLIRRSAESVPNMHCF